VLTAITTHKRTTLVLAFQDSRGGKAAEHADCVAFREFLVGIRFQWSAPAAARIGSGSPAADDFHATAIRRAHSHSFCPSRLCRGYPIHA